MARKHVQRWSVATAFLTVTVYFVFYEHHGQLPSVHRHCWLGGRKGIRPVKRWGDGGGGHWLVWMEWRPAGRSVCLPLLIFHCTIKSRGSLLAPAHQGRPGKPGCKTVVVVTLGYTQHKSH